MNSFINNFEDIDPTFNTNIILFAVECFGSLTKNIDYTDSNGQSLVLISQEKDFVFQHYINNNTYKKILQLIQTLQSSSICTYSLVDTIITYNVFDYITEFYGTLDAVPPHMNITPLNIIKWQKIEPINPIKRGYKTQDFLIPNINKFLFDIGKALYGLHSNNIFHRDCTVDNIGINNKNNFMLFDFDFSCFGGLFNRIKFIEEDYRKLLRSLKMYIEDKEVVEVLEDVISYKDHMLSRLIHIVRLDMKFQNEHETIQFLLTQKIVDNTS